MLGTMSAPCRHEVAPKSAGRRISPHVPRSSRGFADFGPTSGRYYLPTSARHATRADVGTICSHSHPEITPILCRPFPEPKPTAGRQRSPPLTRHACRADFGPLFTRRDPDFLYLHRLDTYVPEPSRFWADQILRKLTSSSFPVVNPTRTRALVDILFQLTLFCILPFQTIPATIPTFLIHSRLYSYQA